MSKQRAGGRILITGDGGQVGDALKQTLAPLGELLAPALDVLDFTEPASIRKVMREFRPRWVVNAAAHTAVDQAEKEPDLAFAMNATGLELLAAEAKDLGAAMIHYSTDYVFDGTKETPYVESDKPNPLNVYGRSKLAGEAALSASGAGETTWYGFAVQAIAELQQLEAETKLATVEAISTAEYPTPAQRPMNSRLDCGKLERTFGWRMLDWRDSLKAVFQELPRP